MWVFGLALLLVYLTSHHKAGAQLLGWSFWFLFLAFIIAFGWALHAFEFVFRMHLMAFHVLFGGN